jgi:cytochrome c biogenesis protein CcmG, thiol:disulfide interchange protein DsbE
MTGPEIPSTTKARAARIAFWAGLGLLVASLIFAAAVKLRQALPGDFTLPSPGGGAIHLADFRGKAVVLNFWASWCVPCAEEMPALEAFYQLHKGQDVVVIGVDVGETADTAAAFALQHGVTFPIVLDQDAAVADRYGLRGLPMTLVIDRMGLIRWSHLGQVVPAMLEEQLALP